MEEDIPFTVVDYGIWQSLANKLDPDSGLHGNNWRMLAEKLGYSTEQILCMESKKTTHGRNTITLFEEYLVKKNCSVKALKESLESMERPDALQILLEAMPEIERKYKAERRQHMMKMEPQEHTEDYGPYHHNMYLSMANGHSAIPKYHPHNIRPGYHPPNYNQMNIVCPTYSTTYSNLDMDICTSTTSSSVSTSRQLKEINRTHNYQRPQHTHTHIESGVIRYRPQGGATNMHHPGMSGVQQSMAVHVDNRDNYTADDVDMMDVSRTVAREEPQPLPPAIYRNENHYRASLSRVPPLLNPNDMNVDREEVVTSNTFLEPPVSHHAPLGRQASEESNTRQPLIEPRFPHKKLALNISAAPSVRSQITNGQEFVSPSPTQTPTSVSQSPLDKLQQFMGSEIYMPDEKYKNMIEQKNREEILYNRSTDDVHKKRPGRSCGHGAGTVHSKENTPNDWFNFHSRNTEAADLSASQSSDITGKSISSDRDQIVKTFPLRAKSMLACGSPELSQERPSVLTKSQSMPSDMKPAEYRRAFRYIKVFVTYAAESKRHIHRVLNLCRCLEKNGFTCCMDMFDRKMPTADKEGWVEQRFTEADFILMCVSQRYLNETALYEENDDEMIDNQLHTTQIYRLMQEEYRQIGRNRRFIPVMVDGTGEEHIPNWLQNTLHYKWPTHYRDLLWFLTKPETRIKTRPHSDAMSDQSSPSPQSPNSPVLEN